MNLRHLSARAAVAGITTALAAGALVGVSTTAANAESVTAPYSCSAGSTTLPIGVTATADLSGYPSLASGTPVSPGLVSLNLTFTVPADVVNALMAPPYNQTQIGGGSSDLAFPIGKGSVPIAAFTIDPVQLVHDTPATLTKQVSNSAFNLPEAGAAAVTMPASFTLNSIMPLACTTDSKQVITTYTISKQTASVTAKAPKSVKKNKAFSVVVKVAGQNKPATGKVTAKVGKKTIGTGVLKKGKAAIKVKKGLKKTSKITFVYAGDKSTAGSSSFPVKVTVKK
ncbi:Ig-like domain repeat protein [Nocardioides conyzicola]|uniref:Bacterial Ig-like domain-containing protein n=1 Tax=Nocardioides conyzicola TaxID=1651781 RepID=A0ABP8WVH0_9ACTN